MNRHVLGYKGTTSNIFLKSNTDKSNSEGKQRQTEYESGSLSEGEQHEEDTWAGKDNIFSSQGRS